MTKRLKPDASCRCVPALRVLKMEHTVDDEADESIGYFIILAKHCAHEDAVLTVLGSNMDPEEMPARTEHALKFLKAEFEAEATDERPIKPPLRTTMKLLSQGERLAIAPVLQAAMSQDARGIAISPGRRRRRLAVALRNNGRKRIHDAAEMGQPRADALRPT
jgi:hypothetical protein